MKHNPLRRIPAKSPAGTAVDLTEIFRRAGLPYEVFGSARFAARHRLTGADCERCEEHYALIWTVRSALTGSLPARRFRTSRGELLLIEYVGFPDGDGQDKTVWVAALRPAPRLVQLLLPEELDDLI